MGRRILKLINIVMINLFIFIAILIFLEIILRIIHHDKPTIFKLDLMLSYYEMFTPRPSSNNNVVRVNGVTTKILTPTNPKIGTIVYMFGGSTTAGSLGSNDPNEKSDFQTIAAHLAKISIEKRQPFIVENFGVGNYRSNEELMKIIKLLRSGSRPDIALFYDGYNDVEFALKGQVRYDILKPLEYVFEPDVPYDFLIKALRQFEIYRILDKSPYIQNKITGLLTKILSRKRPESMTEPIDNIKLDTFEERKKYCVENYYENTRIIIQLAKEYKFIPVFILQPMIYFKKEMSPLEKNVYKNLPDYLKDGHPKLYDAIILKMSDYKNFFLITNIFDYTKDTIFPIDQGHTHSQGNKVIAERLFEIIQKVLPKSKRVHL